MDEILKLIDSYWRFDNYQQPTSSWHDKQDLLDEVRKVMEKNRARSNYSKFHLTELEDKLFKESESKSIRFDRIGGIETGVSYLSNSGDWIDITDYSCW